MSRNNSLSPQLLGHIALMQSVVAQLPDKQSMLSFVCQGLKDIAGVEKVDYKPADNINSDNNPSPELNCHFFPIVRKDKNHGVIVFNLSNYELFSPYLPYIKNFINMLAIVFDEIHQRKVNQNLLDDLENRVAERTLELELEIKERKSIEKALRESEENLQTTLNSIGDAVIATDLYGKVVRMNPVAEKLTGWEIDEAVDKPLTTVFNIIDSRTGTQIENPVNKVLRDGHTINLTNHTLLVSKDGTEYPIGDSAAPILDSEKNITGIVLVFRDMTKEYKIRDSQEKARKRLENIIKGTNAGTWDWNVQTGELIINERWAEIIGYSMNELNPISIDTWFSSIHPEDIEHAKKKLENHFYGKDPYYDVVYRQMSKTKTWIWVNTRGKVIEWTDDNKPLIMSGTHLDVTESKLAADSLLESKRLGAFGEMSSAVAHDFNNSLQTILGNLELSMREPNISDKLFKYLRTIQLAALDATTRVQVLQRFAGKKIGESKHSNITLNSVIEEAILQARPLWKDESEKKGLRISVQTKFEGNHTILGNESELRTVFYNLIKNSVEAMPSGGDILITTISEDAEVVVYVKDSGIGMDEETKKKVFQPFFSTKGFESGRGLGLSGAFSIIAEHKGKIEIYESNVNEGTTIALRLPIVSSTIEEKEIKPVISSKGSARVLWVDDEEMIREIAKEILELLKHTGDVTDSGEKALDLLNKNEYDLVITDVGMPGMTGWELASQINERFNGNVTVAALTGWGSEITDEEKDLYNISHIISKPMSISDIQNLIAKVLSKQNPPKK